MLAFVVRLFTEAWICDGVGGVPGFRKAGRFGALRRRVKSHQYKRRGASPRVQ
tara:strand:+ start:580 stop:738 length:159 start_codon:yes stop_codon:yes gene_type:complete